MPRQYKLEITELGQTFEFYLHDDDLLESVPKPGGAPPVMTIQARINRIAFFKDLLRHLRETSLDKLEVNKVST